MVLFPMINEACRVLDEGVVARASDLDVATVLGMSFPSYCGGIMFWADTVGSKHIYLSLKKWSERYGSYFKPSRYLEERAMKGMPLVNETAVIHCGFYSENGGFKISDEDKSYMQGCKVAVSTCAFGGGDDLYQPIGMSEASLKKVCYVQDFLLLQNGKIDYGEFVAMVLIFSLLVDCTTDPEYDDS
ncbi:hypothetical protein E1A91_D07G185300v1 [Gossypium mustelinum]|uniref:Uncharacterized protein n=2 Tax=Gossypium mustelinum TaxID=34275 RepID=A0A5D2UCB2_GOSMU|nr:hypothetical protein E1A91_D07G185300v1 [Gossypium mustelinum]TYI74226.1 hypothetical protein E1A91_D07G185300v1 [Gossypium mustelinum]TYI74227.1 hypothetical protein E1A91_D07G185300v1 [Gossypium mustelinum]